jgi:hypothetical protein
MHKQITLEIAAFLDSDPARELTSVEMADLRSIAEQFIELCYERIGKKPAGLDGEDLRLLLGSELPARMAVRDRLAAHVPAVLTAYFDHLEQAQLVPHAYEIRSALEAALPAFVALVSTGRNAPYQVHEPLKPMVHGAPKLGRNDPCSCGSGKKFKKCHGRNA